MAYHEITPKSNRIWDTAGRGTPAGHALFRLYNGFAAARRKGDQFSLENQINILRQISRRGSQPSDTVDHHELPKKPTVRVPHFRKRNYQVGSREIYDYGGRRKASLILKKLQEDLAKVELPPQPTKPLLDEKEKERVQWLFEWDGRIFEDDFDDDQPVKHVPEIVKGSKEEKEHLLDLIAGEVDERHTFLKEMEKLGKAGKYKNQIQLEIQERVKQMKLLDEMITSEESSTQKKDS